jgi:hypothetical protein
VSSQRYDGDLVREWLDESYEAQREPARFLDHLVDAVPDTPQRRRRWWHVVRSRRVHTPSVRDAIGYQPSPIPASNGHTPTVIGRTQTMLSPVKAITAGALVFAIGSAFLIAQPLDQSEAVAPGAEAGEYAEPVKFTARIVNGPAVRQPACEAVGGMTQCLGIAWSPLITDVSDPRLDGVMTVSQDQNQWPLQPWLIMQTYRISDEDGAWQGSFPNVIDMGDGGEFGNASVLLVGEGAYEGLYAWMDTSDWNAITGVIFSAPPPAAPVPPELP